VKGIRGKHSIWTVARIEIDEHGRDDGFLPVASFWDEDEALADRQRRANAISDPTLRFEVVRAEATAVYPADESPPWAGDPDRLKRRGYEAQ
jgi:hypothetical protein